MICTIQISKDKGNLWCLKFYKNDYKTSNLFLYQAEITHWPLTRVNPRIAEDKGHTHKHTNNHTQANNTKLSRKTQDCWRATERAQQSGDRGATSGGGGKLCSTLVGRYSRLAGATTCLPIKGGIRKGIGKYTRSVISTGDFLQKG